MNNIVHLNANKTLHTILLYNISANFEPGKLKRPLCYSNHIVEQFLSMNA